MLPVGIQSLGEIRRMGCYYVDKTAHVLRLAREGKYHFLSRPRRFGKSLLIDTLKELFEGNGELFRGLAIHGEWDWAVKNPVMRISFGSGNFLDPSWLAESVAMQLDVIGENTGIGPRYSAAPARFAHLIRALHQATGERVVVLVDEYDKPILDALSDSKAAGANRDFLRGFYGVIKDCDEHIRFCFLTGVSKLLKAGLFSGLNNLRDITLSPAYGTICGYKDDDLDTVFAPELEGLDRDEIRRWYNGYNWLGEGKVYNPFDILLLFRRREFGNHWFDTGTPTFLTDLLARRRMAPPALEGLVADDALLSAFDVDRIEPEALLFQTGYLTIAEEVRQGGEPVYRLGHPNHEVRCSLNRWLLRGMVPDAGRGEADQVRLHALTRADDLEGVRGLFEAFFAGIPYEWYRRNDLVHYEGYWAALMYSHFAAAGLDVRVEGMTPHGRLDMAVVCPGHVHLYEFKVVNGKPEDRALEQMRERGYADKYRGPGRTDPAGRRRVRRDGTQHHRLLGRDGLSGGISDRAVCAAVPPPRPILTDPTYGSRDLPQRSPNNGNCPPVHRIPTGGRTCGTRNARPTRPGMAIETFDAHLHGQTPVPDRHHLFEPEVPAQLVLGRQRFGGRCASPVGGLVSTGGHPLMWAEAVCQCGGAETGDRGPHRYRQ